MDQNKEEPKEIPSPVQPPSAPVEPTSTLIVEPLQIQDSDTTAELIHDEPKPEPSKFSNFLVGLGVLMIAGFILAVAIALGLINQYIAFGLTILLVPIFGVLSLIFIGGTVVNTVKHKPSARRGLFSVLSMAVAIPILLCTGTLLVQWWVIFPAEGRERSKEQEARTQLIEAEKKSEMEQYALEHKKDEITKEKAISLLNSCQVGDFYYENQTKKEQGNWGEYSATGIVLTVDDRVTMPNGISIADRLIPELVPIAMNSLKQCDELTVWNDDEDIDSYSE